MAFRSNPLLGYWARGYVNPTRAEQAADVAVAALGEPYRFQYPFMSLKYFADFALLNRKLIIEVDGDSHDSPAQKEKDLLHEQQVLELGWRVVRVSNEAVLANSYQAIQAAVAQEFPDKDALETQLTERLARLYQSYPHLLAEGAKLAKRRRQSGLKGAQKRRERKAAGAYSPRKRATAGPLPA